jgi:hypothetical protein
LSKTDGASERRLRLYCFPFSLAILALSVMTTQAQSKTDAPYARRNSIGILAAYSWDSSHILLGASEQRMLVNIGASYNRRLLLNHVVNWQYSGELLPVALESDPNSRDVVNQTSPTVGTFIYNNGYPLLTCGPQTASYSVTDPASGVTYSGTTTISCAGRRWTIGEAMSPIGFQWNFMPLRRMQPLIDAHGGYMYSTQPIPVASAGSFNFTFDIGAGIEFYRSKSRSVRVEYRYHHISNDNTATINPGIDNGLFQITYCFGR